MPSIAFKTKVQTIYYKTAQEELGQTYVVIDKRLSIPEAKDILLDRNIEYKELLKVKYEVLQLEMPLDEFAAHII